MTETIGERKALMRARRAEELVAKHEALLFEIADLERGTRSYNSACDECSGGCRGHETKVQGLLREAGFLS